MILNFRTLWPKYEYPSIRDFNRGSFNRAQRKNEMKALQAQTALIHLALYSSLVCGFGCWIEFLGGFFNDFPPDDSLCGLALFLEVFHMSAVFISRFYVSLNEDKINLLIVEDVLES